jgi:hypothetical protein
MIKQLQYIRDDLSEKQENMRKSEEDWRNVEHTDICIAGVPAKEKQKQILEEPHVMKNTDVFPRSQTFKYDKYKEIKIDTS